MDDLSRFCCHDPDYPNVGQLGIGNLSLCPRAKKTLQQHRLLYFHSYDGRFSERKWTPLFDCRLPRDRALAVLRHLADGCGVWQTARLVGVNKNTVVRLAPRAGRHARHLRYKLVGFCLLDPQAVAGSEVVPRRQAGKAL